MLIRPDATALASLAKLRKEVNHLYVVENYLRKLLTVTASANAKCVLSTTLTDYGRISVVLAAMDPEDTPVCVAARRELIEKINKNRKNKLQQMGGTARFLSPVNPVQQVVDSVNSKAEETARTSYNDALEGLDNVASAASTQKKAVSLITFVAVLAVGILLAA